MIYTLPASLSVANTATHAKVPYQNMSSPGLVLSIGYVTANVVIQTHHGPDTIGQEVNCMGITLLHGNVIALGCLLVLNLHAVQSPRHHYSSKAQGSMQQHAGYQDVDASYWDSCQIRALGYIAGYASREHFSPKTRMGDCLGLA